MKIRIGFVSNSSTSSFVLIGKKLTMDQALGISNKNGRLMAISPIGDDNGLFVFNVTKEYMDWIMDNHAGECYTLVDPSYCEFDGCYGSNLPTIAKQGLSIWSGEASFHSPENIEDLQEKTEYIRGQL